MGTLAAMRQAWTLVLSGQILVCFCEGVNFEGIAEVEEIPLSYVYLIGSKWAITIANPFQRYTDLGNINTIIKISNDTIAIEEIKMNNDLMDILDTSINLALIKLVRPAHQHEVILLNPNYPEEGMTVYMTNNRDHAAFRTTTYERCQEHFGYTVGVFCISNVTETNDYPGKGIFHDGMLTGLTTEVSLEGFQLVTAIAPALRWITDTMSNIIHR